MPRLAALLAAALLAAALLGVGANPLAAQVDAARVGIDFGRDLAEALAAAEVSGKPVLVDAMTTWCKPCLEMDRKVFRDSAVGTFVNERFVAVKLDMERGGGPEAAERYGVRAYPTLLVVDAAGDEIDRSVGYLDADGLVGFLAPLAPADGAAAAGPAAGSYAALDARFRAGVRDTAELRELVAFGERADLPATPTYVLALLAATGDGGDSPEAVALVLRHAAADNALFDLLASRRSAYAAVAGDYGVGAAFARALDVGLFPGDGEAAVRPGAAKRLLARAYPADEAAADSTYLRYRMRRAREAGKAKPYGRWALRWQERYPTDDPDELDELVYLFEERLPGWKPEAVAEWKRRRDELWDVGG